MLTILLLLMAVPADLFSPHGEKAVVLLFIRSDCPISNRYVPEVRRLFQKYSTQGIDFRLVYAEPGLDSAAMEKHRKEYGYTIPALLDKDHAYVNRAGARITPEAAVFVQGKLVYLGRIDDLYVDLGKPKRAVESHDLEDVLSALAAGKSVQFRKTRAIGCAIENLP
jgi:DNA-binding transcriptional LysR family regulator